MNSDEKAIITKWFNVTQKYSYYQDYSGCLQEIKNINRAITQKDNEEVSPEFFQEIVSYHKLGKLNNITFLAEVFVMTKAPTSLHIEYVFEHVICSSGYHSITAKLYEKPEWKDYKFGVHHIITYLTHKNCKQHSYFTGKKFASILNNLKETLDEDKIEKIFVKIQNGSSSSRILDILYFFNDLSSSPSQDLSKKSQDLSSQDPSKDPSKDLSQDPSKDNKESKAQKLYNKLIKTYYNGSNKSNDTKLLKDALSQENYEGIANMYRLFNVKPHIDHFNIVIYPKSYTARGWVNNSHLSWLVELMVEKGLILSYSDIVSAVRYKFFIRNVEQFLNTSEKKELAAECLKLHYFKYHNLLGIDEDTADMYECCTAEHSSSYGIKRLLKKGYIPDRLALKYACENSKQKKSMPLLFEYIKPDAELFDIYCNTCDSSGLLSKMNKMVNKRLSYQESKDDSDESDDSES